MSKPINILQLTTSSDIGGAENVVLDIMTHSSPDFKYCIASFKGEKLLLERAAQRGIPAYFINKVKLLNVIPALNAIVHEHKIDLVQTHGLLAQIFAVPVCKKNNIPLIVTVHGMIDIDSLIKSYVFKNTRHFVRSYISVTEEGKRFLNTHMGVKNEKINVIHNGILIEKSADVENRKDTNTLVTNVLTVANLRDLKGHRVILKAAKKLRENHIKNVHFVFVGRDDSRGAIHAFAKELNVLDMVTFAGFQNDVSDYYSRAHIFLLPSETEGLPLSILDAMHLGLPVIASRVGGIPEMINDKINGILIPPQNPEELYTALVDLLENPAKRDELGKNARQTIEEKFSMHEMISAYEAFYTKIVKS